MQIFWHLPWVFVDDCPQPGHSRPLSFCLSKQNMRATNGAQSSKILTFPLSWTKCDTHVSPKLLRIELIYMVCKYKPFSLHHFEYIYNLKLCISSLILLIYSFKISTILFNIQIFNMVITSHCLFFENIKTSCKILT